MKYIPRSNLYVFFRWRQQTYESRTQHTSHESGYEPRESLISNEQYNEKSEIEERLGVHKSELSRDEDVQSKTTFYESIWYNNNWKF